MRSLHLSVFALLFLSKTYAQPQVDSVFTLYEQATNDSARIAHGLWLIGNLQNKEPLRAIDIGEQVMQLLDNEKTTASDSVLTQQRLACLGRLASIYEQLGDNRKGVALRMEVLAQAQKSGNLNAIRGALMNLGVRYQMQGLPKEAMDYYRRALALARQDSDTYGIAMSLGNIGTLFGTSNPDSSLYYHKRSLEEMRKPGMRDREGAMGWMMNNIGSCYEAQGRLDSAMYYYQKSLELRQSIDHHQGLFLIHLALARLYERMGNREKAMQHINTSIQIGEQKGFVEGLYNSYLFRSELREKNGDFSGALKDHQLYLQYRDATRNEEDATNLVRQTTRYEYSQKHLADSLSYATTIALQQKETQRQRLLRNGFMGGFAVVVLFAGIFFYQRNRIKKGKQRSDELLLNILPAEVADELKAKGSADARLIDEVTVLFSDFKEFTQISETQPPEVLVAEINECFSAFDLIVQKYGVEKIKTVGDAYLAAGGLPTPNQTHAADVIKAALEIQAFMADRQRKRAAEGLFYFEARIGAHTGPVVAGIVGVKKFAYDIWGDTVNTAQRMESTSEAGRINISDSTYALVKDQFRCTHRGKVSTKGKGDVDMYFVEQ